MSAGLLYCHWHRDWIPADEAVYMGTTPAAPGVSTARYACTPCILALDLPIPPTPGNLDTRTVGAA